MIFSHCPFCYSSLQGYENYGDTFYCDSDQHFFEIEFIKPDYFRIMWSIRLNNKRATVRLIHDLASKSPLLSTKIIIISNTTIQLNDLIAFSFSIEEQFKQINTLLAFQ